MKYLLLSLFSFSALADCHLFQLKGLVKVENAEIFLTVNKGTLSERKYQALRSNEKEFAPFIDQFISGEFILGAANPLSGSKLLSVSKLDRAVPDPLNHAGEFVLKKKVPCPK